MRVFFLTALCVYVIDRVTKIWVLNTQVLPLEISPFFRIVKVWNSGMVFGLGGGLFLKTKGLVFLLTIALLFLVVLISFKTRSASEKLILGMIFGGGLGNLTDRLLYGRVLDFFDLHLKGLHWPAFNVADVAITISIFTFLVLTLRKEKRCT
jgi:signal peptidase II